MADGDWRDEVGEDRPGFGLGDLTDDDALTVEFLDEGRMTETRHGQALQIGVGVVEAPDGYTAMDDEPLEEGEEYNLMTSSSRFQVALRDFADSLTGARAVIRADGSGFARTYTVESA